MNDTDATDEVLARTRHQGLNALDNPDVFRILWEYFGGSATEMGIHLGSPGKPVVPQSVNTRRRHLEAKFGVTLPRIGRGIEGGRALKVARESAANNPAEQRPENASNAALLHSISLLQSRLAKEQARTGIIVEALKDCITVLPPLKVPKVSTKGKGREQIMVSLFGDGHVGAMADPIAASGMANYNFEVFRERLWKLRDGIFSIAEKERKSSPIRTLYIDWLGDMLEGESLFPGQPHQIDMSLLGQFVRGAREIAAYIREMAGFFEKVVIHAVPGNHPEGRKTQEIAHPVSRAETTFLLLIEAMLQNQPNVEFFISPSRFMVYRVFDYYTLMMHGQECRSTMNLPYYGLDRTTHRMVQLAQVPLSVVELGHHHVAAQINVMFVKAMMNGSMVGPSQYSVAKLQTGSFPSQTVYGVHPERPFTWVYEIQLGDRPQLEFDESGVGTPWISGQDGRGVQTP